MSGGRPGVEKIKYKFTASSLVLHCCPAGLLGVCWHPIITEERERSPPPLSCYCWRILIVATIFVNYKQTLIDVIWLQAPLIWYSISDNPIIAVTRAQQLTLGPAGKTIHLGVPLGVSRWHYLAKFCQEYLYIASYWVVYGWSRMSTIPLQLPLADLKSGDPISGSLHYTPSIL